MPLCSIEEIKALEILDSRGNPTLRVCIKACDRIACSSVPSGASTGKHEAFELRDGEKRLRGRGVKKAVENINEIITQALVGEEITNLRRSDETLKSIDGTPNKSKLGANAILGVSMAVARLLSELYGIPLYAALGGIMRRRLPTPLLNVINGGKHAGNSMSFQEFLLIPHGFSKFSEAIWASVEVYYTLKDIIKQKYGAIFTSVGDEGGFAPPVTDPNEALKLLHDAVTSSGYRVEDDFSFGIDAASSNFYNEKKGKYIVNNKELSIDELFELYHTFIESSSVRVIEDPFYEEDFGSFALITQEAKKLGAIIVGDDLLTTNINRLKKAIEERSVSAVLIKPNQIGTVSETVDFSSLAIYNGLKRIVSHRSGETEDTFIADLAVALGSEGIKTGAPARSERTSKYNRLLEIESELGSEATYAGRDLFRSGSSTP
jgi:enolase